MPTPETVTGIIRQNLRVAMAREEKTQTQLGELLAMKQQGVSRRLTGTVPWSINDLIEVAKALDMPLSELVPDSLRDATP
jgi:transcriptional regulator with XRE-family HTH domain